jgi:hypothetical protein
MRSPIMGLAATLIGGCARRQPLTSAMSVELRGADGSFQQAGARRGRRPNPGAPACVVAPAAAVGPPGAAGRSRALRIGGGGPATATAAGGATASDCRRYDAAPRRVPMVADSGWRPRLVG